MPFPFSVFCKSTNKFGLFDKFLSINEIGSIISFGGHNQQMGYICVFDVVLVRFVYVCISFLLVCMWSIYILITMCIRLFLDLGDMILVMPYGSENTLCPIYQEHVLESTVLEQEK